MFYKRLLECPDKSCEVKSFAEQSPDIVAVDSSLSTRAAKWVVEQAIEGHSVHSMSRALNCDWHTANRALTNWGPRLLNAEHDNTPNSDNISSSGGGVSESDSSGGVSVSGGSSAGGGVSESDSSGGVSVSGGSSAGGGVIGGVDAVGLDENFMCRRRVDGFTEMCWITTAVVDVRRVRLLGCGARQDCGGFCWVVVSAAVGMETESEMGGGLWTCRGRTGVLIGRLCLMLVWLWIFFMWCKLLTRR